MATQSKAADTGIKPAKPTSAEKGDATTRAARDIIERERAARDANTARLRALRLAKEQETAAAETSVDVQETKTASKKRTKT